MSKRISRISRIKFHSKEDLAIGYYLKKCEEILRSEIKSDYNNINDIIELYNIQLYIENELYLKSWSKEDIKQFEQKADEFRKTVGSFISNIKDDNIVHFSQELSWEYNSQFWQLIDNRNVYKQISKAVFLSILSIKPNLIYTILTNQNLVNYYKVEIKNYLLTYPKSAEILLSTYSTKKDSHTKKKYFPKNLSLLEREEIISNYLDSDHTNLNYIDLIQNTKNVADFKISDKTRLKAQRLAKKEKIKLLEKNSGYKFGVNVSFERNLPTIKKGFTDKEHIINYIYCQDTIEEDTTPYTLLQNFKDFFEYIDEQNRILLVSKKSQIGTIEGIIGIQSKYEYNIGVAFSLSEMTSLAQIYGYYNILNDLNIIMEKSLESVFTQTFHEEYNFDKNAIFSVPTTTISYLEKVRLLAPEFESILKQYKLFVEDGYIDFDLLRISSSPTTIKDIPSLNPNKYFYFNEDNKVMLGCSYLFFSDQSLLGYIEPFQDKNYSTFFDLLVNENINYSNFEDYNKPEIDHLIDKGFIHLDTKGFIQITNFERLYILKDLSDNEFASFHHYPKKFQQEALRMSSENIIYFENTLFSKQEHSYFNYHLNKSEFTNGQDLRNKYLHGSQADPSKINKHAEAYFTYLKLLVLVMLKIDDDLMISKAINTDSKI